MPPDIDEEDELQVEEEEDDQQLKPEAMKGPEKWSESDPRIKQVAADLVEHFEERNKAPDRQGIDSRHELANSRSIPL